MTSLASPVAQRDNMLAPFQNAEPSNQPMPITKSSALILAGDAMERIFKFAEMMAKGSVTVPHHLQGNSSDCLAVVMQATQWGMNPFAVAQKTHVTPSGCLGYEAQLISAVITECGPVEGLPEYEYFGDWSKVLGKVEERKSEKGGKYYVPTYTREDEKGLGVRCSLQVKGEKKPRVMEVFMSQCYPRFSTQWATDPKMQIGYVAIRKWGRQNTPGVILGVYSDDEIGPTEPVRHMGAADVVGSTTPAANASQSDDPLVINARAEAGKGRDSFLAWWQAMEKSKRLALHSRLPEFEAIAKKADDARTVDNGTPAAEAAKPATKAAAPAKPAASQPAAATGFTFESVMDRMDKAHAARDIDALNIAADLIGSVTERQRELEVIYEQYLGELS